MNEDPLVAVATDEPVASIREPHIDFSNWHGNLLLIG
jgi:hypothetical protein